MIKRLANLKLSARQKKIAVILGAAVFLYLLLTFLVPFLLIKKSGPFSCAVYDKNGRLLGAQVAKDEQWRFEGGKVPDKFAKAIVTYEDKRFYFHFGVDFISIGRAIISNVKTRRIVSGGSTITMQTVRILEKNPRRTFVQKIHEAFVAVFLEARYSKRHILELYAANAPFGGNVVGLEAASWRYFNLPPEELTWAECATLAVLPNQPSLVYPGADNKISSPLLLQKRNNLLLKLAEKKYLDNETLALSLDESLPGKPYELPSLAYHYLEYLKSQNPRQTKFYTTIDFYLQENTSRNVEQWSKNFSNHGINNLAAVILETKTKNVAAYIGNTGFGGRNKNSWAVDLVQAKRSSGSLLKPFLYGAMLDTGQLLPKQLVIDVPTRLGNYRPENNVNSYSGAIPADEALSRSLNIPAIRELREYGLSAFLDLIKKCGFTTLNRTPEEYGLPVILGGGEITLWEATHVYADFMNKANGTNSDFPISRGSAYLTLLALEEGNRPEDEANWEIYANSKKISWKTGTSSGNRDCWAVGTTNEYTVGVWIGNAEGNGTPDLKSVTTAAPVMFDIFSSLPKTTWPNEPSDDLEYVDTCAKSGYAAGVNCTEIKIQLKSKASPLGKPCPYCKAVSLTPDGLFQADAQDLSVEESGKYFGTLPKIEKRFVLPPSLEFWYKKTNLNYKTLPPYVSWHKSMQGDELSIIFPEPNAIIIIPVEITGKKGATIMQAAARSKNEILYWDLDGNFLGFTKENHEMKVSPKPGIHILTVTDGNGNSRQRRFEVQSTED